MNCIQMLLYRFCSLYLQSLHRQGLQRQLQVLDQLGRIIMHTSSAQWKHCDCFPYADGFEKNEAIQQNPIVCI